MVNLQESGKKNNKKKLVGVVASLERSYMNGWIHFKEVFRLYNDKTP